MSSSKRDFERFVVWLHQPATQAPLAVRKLGNLLLANFDALAQTSRQRSHRSVYLVDLARRELNRTSEALPAMQPVAAEGAWPWRRLRHLTLGPFRGFRAPENFDLQKRVNLFYGPNGSGKTSFCEGLEYALLGGVEDAEVKRIDTKAYLANHHARRFDAPSLRATDHLGREIPVIANVDTYRFCFVEKNRIDSFSRIAARPPGQRTELIATLFGMEKFNEFVGHFNESIDQQLVLSATKQVTLTAKRTALATDQTTVNGADQSLKALNAEEAALAREWSTEMTYEGLKQLLGMGGANGRLQELEQLVNAIPPAIVGTTRQGLINAFDIARGKRDELSSIGAKLVALSSQVSFKALYNAVLDLKDTHGDRCPACDTPLTGDYSVASNPYEKAVDGLEQLRELGALQDQQAVAAALVDDFSRALRGQLATVAGFLASRNEQDTPLAQRLAQLPREESGEWWSDIYPPELAAGDAQLGVESWLGLILETAARIEKQDADSVFSSQKRHQNIAERDKLNALRLRVQSQDGKRQQLVETISAAQSRIAAFDEANRGLILEVEQEARNIERDSPIKVAYDRFLTLLKDYRNKLPGTLMAGLNGMAMDLYNEFNRNDLDQDKLVALHLPLTGEEKIEISFRGQPQARVDALQILSEGHIRCLGLAILLAKNNSIQSPLIVFDDAINAIDHEHRQGIRETIFESDYFDQTQLIVTCHSNEFIKDIQQHLPANRRADAALFVFRHHAGDYQPRITAKVRTKNYLEKAREDQGALDSREALGSARRALEMLSQKSWGWLGSHDQGLLQLTIGVNNEVGLRNLCEALRKRLKDAATFNHPNKLPLLTAFEKILGIPEANFVWTCLNKGTHEEANRDDFDAEHVESTLSALEAIDALDLRHGR